VPAAYRYKQDTSDDSTGIVRVADLTDVPPNPALGAWRDYLAWKAAPNTPDTSLATTVAQRRASAKFEIDRQAEEQYRAHLTIGNPAAPMTAAIHQAMLDESRRIATDGSPSGANYPLLNGLNTFFGAALTDRGTTILSAWSAQTTSASAINSVRLKAFSDVNAAGSIAAVDAVVAALTWP
jgi:hypothetical protein